MMRHVTAIQEANSGDLSHHIKADLCASFQRRAIDQLITRTKRAVEWSRERLSKQNKNLQLKHLVVCGGVASNQYLRQRMLQTCTEESIDVLFPPPRYCTDNGVMVAWAGMERYLRGVRSDFETTRYQPRWPLETLEAVH